jgi:hypothetical protein
MKELLSILLGGEFCNDYITLFICFGGICNDFVELFVSNSSGGHIHFGGEGVYNDCSLKVLVLFYPICGEGCLMIIFHCSSPSNSAGVFIYFVGRGY